MIKLYCYYFTDVMLRSGGCWY